LNNATLAKVVLFLDIDSAAEPQLPGALLETSFASRNNDKHTGACFARAQNSAASGSDRRANARRRA